MVYRFADFELDSESRELRSDGHSVRLAKLCLSLLLFLIEHRDRVVSKNELCEYVWEAHSVSDDAIHTAIATVRRAVADTGTNKRVIETAHRSGYRFVAPVTLELVSEAPAEACFVGREAEVSGLLELARRSIRNRRLQVGLLSGDPGIGKTRSALRAAEFARAEDFVVVHGRGSEAMDTPSWWPWIEVFRELKGELDPHTWKRALESASDALLRLLQEVESVAPRTMATNSSNDAFLLVDDMVRLLCRISLSRPLVVVLDDLHRMDPSSLRLVEYALHLNAPAQLLIIGTFRAHEAAGAAIRAVLAAAAKTASSITFELAPLNEPEIARLIASESSRPLGAVYIRRVFERSEGNPFFALELVRQPHQAVGFLTIDAVANLPEGVRSIIAARLELLPPNCLDVLQAASVLGREFEVRELADLLGDAYSMVLERLQPGLDARLLQRVGENNRFSFSHILIRDELCAELPLALRNQLHLAAADSITPATGPLAHQVQERIAHHLYAAAPAGNLERAIGYCIGAARMLLEERYAFQEASRQWQRALELLDLAGEDNTSRLRHVLVSLAKCQFLGGEASVARSTYLNAIDRARSAGDKVDLADATLGLFEPNFSGNFSATFEKDRRNWIGLAREALDGFSVDEQVGLRVQLKSRLSIQLLREHRLDEAEAESCGALRLARLGCDAHIVAAVLADRHAHLLTRGENELALELAEEALRLAQESGDRAQLLRSHIRLLDCGVARGDAILFRTQLDRVVSCGEPLGLYESRKVAVMEAILQGRLCDAQGLLDQVSAELRDGRAEPAASIPFILQQFAVSNLGQGFDGPLRGFAQHVERDPSNLLVQAYLARALAETGQNKKADRCVSMLSDRAADVLQRRDWQVLLLEHAAAAAQVDSSAGAERFSDALRPLQKGFVLWHGGTLCCGPVAQALGLYAGLLEGWAEADSYFEMAIERSKSLGARPFVIAGRTGWAWALLRRGTPVTRARARALLEVAIREASQLGLAGMEAAARKLAS